jgi:hypothetical protein
VLALDLRRIHQTVNEKIVTSFGLRGHGRMKWAGSIGDGIGRGFLCDCGIYRAALSLSGSFANRYLRSIRTYTKSLKLYPTDAWALWNRGLAQKRFTDH